MSDSITKELPSLHEEGNLDKFSYYEDKYDDYSELLDDITEPELSDESLLKNDSDSMIEHNVEFSKLLKSYVLHARISLWTKSIFKWLFLLVALVTMGVVVAALYSIITYTLNGSLGENAIGILISGTVAFLTTFIAIPTIIAKYLFNSEEENRLATIIKDIQDYDVKIREHLKR